MQMDGVPDGARITWVNLSYDTARMDPIPYEVEHTGRLINRDLVGARFLIEMPDGTRAWVPVDRIRRVES